MKMKESRRSVAVYKKINLGQKVIDDKGLALFCAFGNDPAPVAVVERLDGTVEVVPVELIKFVKTFA